MTNTDWHTLPARDVRIGDTYLLSFVEPDSVSTCKCRKELSGGYYDGHICLDGVFYQAEYPLLVKKL